MDVFAQPVGDCHRRREGRTEAAAGRAAELHAAAEAQVEDGATQRTTAAARDDLEREICVQGLRRRFARAGDVGLESGGHPSIILKMFTSYCRSNARQPYCSRHTENARKKSNLLNREQTTVCLNSCRNILAKHMSIRPFHDNAKNFFRNQQSAQLIITNHMPVNQRQ